LRFSSKRIRRCALTVCVVELTPRNRMEKLRRLIFSLNAHLIRGFFFFNISFQSSMKKRSEKIGNHLHPNNFRSRKLLR
jgi:hypothetical protein